MHKLFTLLLLASIYTNLSAQTLTDFSMSNIKANLEFLASDALGGRETASKEIFASSEFIASEFKKFGVKPFGDDSSYFQSIPLSLKGYDKKSSLELFNIDNSIDTLKLGAQFAPMSKRELPNEIKNKQIPIVFCGYGIKEDSLKYNSYADVDVKGKVALVYYGEPFSKNDSTFSRKFARKISDRNYKLKVAQSEGAAAVIVVANQFIMRWWGYIKNSAASNSYSLVKQDTSNTIPYILITPEAYNSYFAQQKLDSLNGGFDLYGEVKSYELDKTIKLNLEFKESVVTGRNVVGIAEGNDPELKGEYILISAHYDHLGVIDGEVYNGADDNGSGTVSVIEAARVISSLKINKRSVIFLLVTGEEKGLLGSTYFTKNCNYSDNIVADINSDMVGRESIDSIFCIGSDKLSSEFFTLVEEANKKSVNMVLDYKYNDPNDPNRYYYRSDHYNFAKLGIPIVFFYDHMKKDYHRASDELQFINFSKIKKVSYLISQIALDVANLNHRLVVDKK